MDNRQYKNNIILRVTTKMRIILTFAKYEIKAKIKNKNNRIKSKFCFTKRI